MTFKIGMKVVCVDATGGWLSNSGRLVDTNELQKGAVYTVRWVGMHKRTACIRLYEVDRRKRPPGFNLSWSGHDEPWFAARFRPAVSPKQEVSFTTGADPDSERFDNRRAREKAWGCSA